MEETLKNMTNEFSWHTAAIVFFTYIFMDILYAMFVIYVGKMQSFASALVSACIYSLGAYGVVTFSKNLLYLFPLATGSFIGTYLIVKFKK
jgi:hypothetical protein